MPVCSVSLQAAAALKKLPLSIDEHHLKYSAIRCSECSEFQAEFSEFEPRGILNHCTTRWLSSEHCIERLIDQWPALYMYCDGEADSVSRNDCVERNIKQLRNPT